MQDLISAFGNIPLSDVIIFIAAIGFLIGLGIKCYKAIVSWHDEMQEKDKKLTEAVDGIKEIKDSYNAMSETVSKILEKQEELEQKQDILEEQNNSHNVNKTRNTLLQGYRYYNNVNSNPTASWSQIEKDTWYNLYKDYVKMGGNGYIKGTIEPEMALLTVIPMTDTTGISALMNSRKG